MKNNVPPNDESNSPTPKSSLLLRVLIGCVVLVAAIFVLSMVASTVMYGTLSVLY